MSRPSNSSIVGHVKEWGEIYFHKRRYHFSISFYWRASPFTLQTFHLSLKILQTIFLLEDILMAQSKHLLLVVYTLLCSSAINIYLKPTHTQRCNSQIFIVSCMFKRANYNIYHPWNLERRFYLLTQFYK